MLGNHGTIFWERVKRRPKFINALWFLSLPVFLVGCQPKFLNPAEGDGSTGGLGSVSQISVGSEDDFRTVAARCVKFEMSTLDSSGASASLTGDVELTLAGDGTYYSDSSCETEASSVTFGGGTNSKDVYYKNNSAGTYSLSATLSGLDAKSFELTLGASYFEIDGGSESSVLTKICKELTIYSRSSSVDTTTASLLEDVSLTLNTTSSVSGTFYENSVCSTEITSAITFSKEQTSYTIYYYSPSEETSTLTATSSTSGYSSNEYALTVTSGSWSTTVSQLSTGVATVTNFVLAASYDTGAVAGLWRQNDGSNQSVYANAYTLSGGWGSSPEIIEDVSSGNVLEPWIAMDAAGRAYATMAGGLERLYNEYSSGSWSGTSNLGSSTTALNMTRVDAGADGYAVSGWYEQSGSTYELKAALRSGSSWAQAEVIHSDGSNDFNGSFDVDINSSGLAAIAYTDTVSNDILAKLYNEGAWQDLGPVDSSADTVADVEAVIDSQGNVVVVWMQQSGGVFQLNGRKYTLSSGMWDGSVTRLDAENEDINSFNIAMTSDGDVHVVWAQDAPANGADIRHKELDGSSNSWGTPTVLNDGSTDAYFPKVAINDLGHVAAGWRQSDGTRNTIRVVRRHGEGASFSSPETQDNGAGSENAGSTQITMDEEGRVMLGWVLNNRVYARKFGP